MARSNLLNHSYQPIIYIEKNWMYNTWVIVHNLDKFVNVIIDYHNILKNQAKSFKK